MMHDVVSAPPSPPAAKAAVNGTSRPGRLLFQRADTRTSQVERLAKQQLESHHELAVLYPSLSSHQRGRAALGETKAPVDNVPAVVNLSPQPLAAQQMRPIASRPHTARVRTSSGSIAEGHLPACLPRRWPHATRCERVSEETGRVNASAKSAASAKLAAVAPDPRPLAARQETAAQRRRFSDQDSPTVPLSPNTKPSRTRPRSAGLSMLVHSGCMDVPEEAQPAEPVDCATKDVSSSSPPLSPLRCNHERWSARCSQKDRTSSEVDRQASTASSCDAASLESTCAGGGPTRSPSPVEDSKRQSVRKDDRLPVKLAKICAPKAQPLLSVPVPKRLPLQIHGHVYSSAVAEHPTPAPIEPVVRESYVYQDSEDESPRMLESVDDPSPRCSESSSSSCLAVAGGPRPWFAMDGAEVAAEVAARLEDQEACNWSSECRRPNPGGPPPPSPRPRTITA